MNKYNQKETMLAEALEEKEQRIKELTVKVDTLTKENKVLNGKLKSLSEKPKESPKSMVTWEDFQKEINAYKKRGSELAGQYFDLKSEYDKLCEERRYWVTQQWAKHLFRWLFLKRHLWIWVVYGMFITFDDGNKIRLQQIYSIVRDYEQAVKHKSDSIVRAEKKKMKEWK